MLLLLLLLQLLAAAAGYVQDLDRTIMKTWVFVAAAAAAAWSAKAKEEREWGSIDEEATIMTDWLPA